MPMKVILLQEVEGLGKPGEIKTVADGYARNFLLPRQMVEMATPNALATLHERVAVEQRRQEKLRAELTALATRLKAVTLKFTVRVGQQGRLYGSVTAQNIVDALRINENIVLDRRSVQLHDPLRALGAAKVKIRLASGFDSEITVELLPEE